MTARKLLPIVKAFIGSKPIERIQDSGECRLYVTQYSPDFKPYVFLNKLREAYSAASTLSSVFSRPTDNVFIGIQYAAPVQRAQKLLRSLSKCNPASVAVRLDEALERQDIFTFNGQPICMVSFGLLLKERMGPFKDCPFLATLPNPREHGRVALMRALPSIGLEANARGTVVHRYRDRHACEVEFMTNDGPKVITLRLDQLNDLEGDAEEEPC